MEEKGFEREILEKANKTLAQWQVMNKFPGAQPISFMQEHMFKLQTSEFLVLEKSDGLRYLLVETLNPDQMFLIDRKYKMH